MLKKLKKGDLVNIDVEKQLSKQSNLGAGYVGYFHTTPTGTTTNPYISEATNTNTTAGDYFYQDNSTTGASITITTARLRYPTGGLTASNSFTIPAYTYNTPPQTIIPVQTKSFTLSKPSFPDYSLMLQDVNEKDKIGICYEKSKEHDECYLIFVRGKMLHIYEDCLELI